MSQLRADLWCSAFVRRHNDLGNFCVVARKGDPIAGQIWIEHDHLDGAVSLYAPAPNLAEQINNADRAFQSRFSRSTPELVNKRIQQEADFDPDFWVISVESRDLDLGIIVVEI